MLDGYSSLVASQSYTYPTANSPAFTPMDTYYTGSIQVTMESSTSGASIYYTTDGNDPTVSGTVYSGPITLNNETVTIKAIAGGPYLNSSSVVSKTYAVLPSKKSSGNQIANGDFSDGLNSWAGWTSAGSDFDDYSFCIADPWTTSYNIGQVALVDYEGNIFAEGTHGSTYGSFGLYQVVPVFKGALYTVNADWWSDTALVGASWCEFIVYNAAWDEINDMGTVLYNNNATFPQASIIAKKDTYSNLNNGESPWDWESITNSMGGDFDNAKGTNTFKATEDYMVVITKYQSAEGVNVAWDNISLSLTAPGDANADAAVDVGDLGILAANYGMTSGATWSQGDFNGDGAVDVGDLGILAANYGTGTSSVADFNADYAKVFGSATASDDTTEDDSDSSICSSMGLSLIAGLALMGLMMVKLEE